MKKITTVLFTFNKNEKLKSKKLIEQLFSEGKSISVFPLRLVYFPAYYEEKIIAKAGVSVSKRFFKKAVQRNQIKRLLREVYRLNKTIYLKDISEQYAFMIIYIGKDLPKFSQIEYKMNQVFEKFVAHIRKSNI